VVEIGAIGLHHAHDCLRVIESLKKEQQLLHVNSGKIYAVVIFLISYANGSAIAQLRPQDPVEMNLGNIDIGRAENLVCRFLQLRLRIKKK
jgi:hypothetical protein